VNRKKLRNIIDKIIIERIGGESLYDPGYAAQKRRSGGGGVFSRRRSNVSNTSRQSRSTSPTAPAQSETPLSSPGILSLATVRTWLTNNRGRLAAGGGLAAGVAWLLNRDDKNIAVIERDSSEPYLFPVPTETSNITSLLGSRPSSRRRIPDTTDDEGNIVQGGGYRPHAGWDIRVSYKDIVAMDDGYVEDTGYNSRGGNFIKISHSNGDFTLSQYYHLARIFIEDGDRVTKGQIIGKSGNSGRTTGPHLHLTLVKPGSSSSSTDSDFYLEIFGKCSTWYLAEVGPNGEILDALDDDETVIDDTIPETPEVEEEEDSYDNPDTIAQELTLATLLGHPEATTASSSGTVTPDDSTEVSGETSGEIEEVPPEEGAGGETSQEPEDELMNILDDLEEKEGEEGEEDEDEDELMNILDDLEGD
tara:strand:- start:1148 stop:2404 length:1257 start_codon:yes stop_codon:yes gene_type:complete